MSKKEYNQLVGFFLKVCDMIRCSCKGFLVLWLGLGGVDCDLKASGLEVVEQGVVSQPKGDSSISPSRRWRALVREISGYIQSPQSDRFWVTEKRKEIEEVLNIMDSKDVGRLYKGDGDKGDGAILDDLDVIYSEVQYLCAVPTECRAAPENDEEEFRLEFQIEGQISAFCQDYVWKK